MSGGGAIPARNGIACENFGLRLQELATSRAMAECPLDRILYSQGRTNVGERHTRSYGSSPASSFGAATAHSKNSGTNSDVPAAKRKRTKGKNRHQAEIDLVRRRQISCLRYGAMAPLLGFECRKLPAARIPSVQAGALHRTQRHAQEHRSTGGSGEPSNANANDRAPAHRLTCAAWALQIALVAADRMVLGNLHQHDLRAVGVPDPSLDESPGFGPRLPVDRDSAPRPVAGARPVRP